MHRPPIVTILGHVDHGKTTILDYFRKSRIAAKEHGGITQRIGGYEVETGIKGYSIDKLTFIDTPGHEAFSQLRARGAKVADIALLIVDAKDSLMPQTVESIYHIKDAKIPFVVVINKIDLPDANPGKIKNDLLKYEVITEDKGGTVPVLEVSAMQGNGMSELLESLLLISSEQNFVYDPKADSIGYIIETKRDKRGIVASIVLKEGTLRVGDTIYAGTTSCKIKAMINDLGTQLKEIQPSTPVELLGFSEMPEIGSAISPNQALIVEKEEEQPKKDKQAIKNDIMAALGFGATEVEEETKKLHLLVKAEAQGSLEAIIQSLAKNEHIKIHMQGVGNINRSDIYLAKTSKSIVIGFNVIADNDVKILAKQEKVIIKSYNIIYQLLEELEEVSKILQEKEIVEKHVKGEAKILATFVIEGETFFGVRINKGKCNINDSIDVYRDGKLVTTTKLVSLKQRAKVVTEVKKDQEAGMAFYPIVDLRQGDMVKCVL